MPAELTCDAPGCGKTMPLQLTSSFRIVVPSGWWILPGALFVVACCQDHMGPAAKAVATAKAD